MVHAAKDPVAIRCPVAGVFQFRQRGDLLFETRILGGITDSPRPQIKCLDTISSVKVCDSEQKEIVIDAEYCLSADTYGRPVDIYSTWLPFFFLQLQSIHARPRSASIDPWRTNRLDVAGASPAILWRTDLIRPAQDCPLPCD